MYSRHHYFLYKPNSVYTLLQHAYFSDCPSPSSLKLMITIDHINIHGNNWGQPEQAPH